MLAVGVNTSVEEDRSSQGHVIVEERGGGGGEVEERR